MDDESKETLRSKIYCAAREGLPVTLFALLASVPKCDYRDYLSSLVVDKEQKCTPLLIAARNGHRPVVQTLLENFGSAVGLEQEGTVQFDGYVIEGATPLWCAAGAGHLDIVRLLVLRGADVNHPTRTISTPLRAASFDGRLDIVRFLVEHGADIHIPNKYNNTCLMIAAYKGHLDVVRYLLSRGADTNTQALCGATALQFAAEHGHLDIVRELLECNARILANGIGMTPLLAAAERTKAEVVEYLVKQPWCTRREKIDALELLGASFANDKDNYSLERAFRYLELAMREREREPRLQKECGPVVAAYDSRVECATLDELYSIRDDPHALHMESLVIRERILGQHNPELPHHVVYRGAVFADSAAFDRCLQLWLHALRLRSAARLPLRKDLLRFAQVFSQMLHIGVEVPPGAVAQILSASIHELESGSDEDNDANMLTSLYLLVVVGKLRFTSARTCCTELFIVIVIIIILRVTRDGCTLLHLCVSADTPVDDFHTKNICHFPCTDTTRLLLRCGADPNAVDARRNTPLHAIVTYQKPISDFLTLHSIIVALIEAGVHADATNARGETAAEAATTGVAEVILRTQTQVTLRCLAARAVAKYGLSYRAGEIPRSLVHFVEMHGGRTRPLPRPGAD
ncbi:hypothetical protein HPB52_020409 [Rhipicephalus sanguineus]|uniref:Uncharacterized protein n=1 Tax=Rhipicephalus sanguineus TaxID=34632 RepID=A0A9D4SZZ5_RHISA|nr:hypothetical protein HPB52_020409 [Rhipicephalus sanguineus]